MLIQIADESGHDLVHGAVDYESIVASGPTQPPPVEPSPDDLYVLYTGGTTGMPKGVLWRQHDIFMTSFGGRNMYTGEVTASYDEIAKRVAENPGTKIFTLPPLMHGAAQWAVMTALTTGQTVVFPTTQGTFDADEVVRTIEREKVMTVQVVGDAMARPIADAIERGTADVSSLAVVANGGALLTPTAKQRLIDIKPGLIVMDGVGSSETGIQMSHMSMPGAVSTGTFNAGPDTSVAAEELDSILGPGHDGMGWLAQRGYVPLGYKGDAAKTAKTFPVIDGVRYSIPGDRARHLAEGGIELLGRDSVTINSGGEKIFAEEVETRPAVAPRGGRRRGVRAAERAVGSGGRRDRRPHRRRQRRRRRSSSSTRRASSPATSCRRPLCSGPSSNEARRARLTTGGRANRRSARAHKSDPGVRRPATHHSILLYCNLYSTHSRMSVRSRMLEIRRGHRSAGRHGRRSGRSPP